MYAVHDDMKGHTGATLSLGKGGIYSGAWKQRLVARSSTESELIGVLSNHNPAGIWKQKYIGTWKHNSEAVGEAKHNHVTKDSDGSTRDVFPENIRGTTPQATDGDDRSSEQRDAGGKQRGNKHEVVEP